MTRFERKEFTYKNTPCPWDQETGHRQIIEGFDFDRCLFDGQSLVTYGTPAERSVARHLKLTRCSVAGFLGLGAIFEDIHIDNLKIPGRDPFALKGCCFKHVKLSGPCGQFLFHHQIDVCDQDRSAAFHSANADYYREVDWALDISEMSAAGFYLRGSVPVSLIRRNPEEQFIMDREVAVAGSWKAIDTAKLLNGSIEMFLEAGGPQELFVACPRSKHFERDLTLYRKLRDAKLMS